MNRLKGILVFLSGWLVYVMASLPLHPIEQAIDGGTGARVALSVAFGQVVLYLYYRLLVKPYFPFSGFVSGLKAVAIVNFTLINLFLSFFFGAGAIMVSQIVHTEGFLTLIGYSFLPPMMIAFTAGIVAVSLRKGDKQLAEGVTRPFRLAGAKYDGILNVE